MGNKMKKNKKDYKKHINHDPRTESAKAIFGEPKAKEYNPKDFKI